MAVTYADGRKVMEVYSIRHGLYSEGSWCWGMGTEGRMGVGEDLMCSKSLLFQPEQRRVYS